jgi:murein L,D-transpeptidase YcbB/YkuD
MRRLLLATLAAALLLGFAGEAVAGRNADFPPATTLAPLRTTTATGLMFSKNTDEAAQIEQWNPVAQPAATDEATPLRSSPLPNDQAAPTEQATKPVDDMKPAIAAEDAALADQLRDLVEGKLSQFVPKEHDRAGVLAFYRSRNYAPLWIAGGKAAPRTQQALEFLRGVEADGLDPADYPVPAFTDSNPDKLAAAELTLTNSVVTFARHASIGRTAFSRVSGAVWYDQKAPNPADVLGKLAESGDVRATLDGYNPQAPAYKALKAELAAVRSATGTVPEPKPAHNKEANKGKKAKKGKRKEEAQVAKPRETSKAARIDTIVANMERWRWMPHQLGAAYVMVNIPDYTLKVVKDGKTVWQTKIDEIHHRQSDLERAAVDHPQRIPAGAGPGSECAGPGRAEDGPQSRRLGPHLSAAG